MKVLLRVRWDKPWTDVQGRDRFPERKTAAWQHHRRQLWHRYTLPSLVAQTHTDWEAVLLCDIDNRAHHAELHGPRCRVVYGGLGATDEDVLLMRIDSDDILAPEALATLVQAAADLGDKTYAQLDTGVAYHVATDTLYQWANPSPPFYGRVVRAGSTLPGLGHHAQVRPECKVIQTDDPMFCVVLHDTNISNCRERAWCLPTPHNPNTLHRMGLQGLQANTP